MSRIVLFGAGGRAGRRILAQARARGHDVLAVMRHPHAHPDIDGVTGDVTDVADVRRLTAGADAVINAGASMDVPPDQFFSASTHALIGGLQTRRLLVIGIGTTLEPTPGIRLVDTPDFPDEAKPFTVGHALELELLQQSPSELDWVVITPPPVVIAEHAETGPLLVSAGPELLHSSDPTFTYTDLAVATVDAIDNPTHHRTQIAVVRN